MMEDSKEVLNHETQGLINVNLRGEQRHLFRGSRRRRIRRGADRMKG